jgi:protein-S-isoprenylcysteine O-methyltransferase Ste14
LNAIPLTMFISFFYAVFPPLQPGATWLYSGTLIYLFGMVFTIVAVLNFATSPKNRLITKGLYRVTRNPVYVGMLLMQISIAVTCSSWLYLLLTAVLLILLNAILSAEERYCLETYGDTYRKYMSRTPRWIGIPKSKKNE